MDNCQCTIVAGVAVAIERAQSSSTLRDIRPTSSPLELPFRKLRRIRTGRPNMRSHSSCVETGRAVTDFSVQMQGFLSPWAYVQT
jgi:hypothetical protein